jgi:hypothetical protein
MFPSVSLSAGAATCTPCSAGHYSESSGAWWGVGNPIVEWGRRIERGCGGSCVVLGQQVSKLSFISVSVPPCPHPLSPACHHAKHDRDCRACRPCHPYERTHTAHVRWTVRAYHVQLEVPSIVCVPRDGRRARWRGLIAPPFTRRRLVMQPMPRWILLPRSISCIVCICIARSKCL